MDKLLILGIFVIGCLVTVAGGSIVFIMCLCITQEIILIFN